MNEMRSIDIDFDVHKAIETARLSFSETPNDVLRRLLTISDENKTRKNNKNQPQQGLSWAGKGVELPHGTKIRMNYNGSAHEGIISNGKWLIDGHVFSSPSAAANDVAITKDGNKTNLNGWDYWEVLFLGSGRWRKLASLRKH